MGGHALCALALVGVCEPGAEGLAALLGAAMGYLSFRGVVEGLRYIAASMMVYAVALAPMAGVSDLAFRTVGRELSGCYTVSEMVSAKALCYGDKKTPVLLRLGEGEHPAAE